MRLLLIRHGQTPANVLGLLDTAHPGPGLTELGRRQAEAVPGALRNEAIEGIFVSTLLRTQLTAEPLAEERGLARRITEGLHEIEAGELEGLSSYADQIRYMEVAFSWAAGELDVTMPGGPDGHEFFGRFDNAIEAIEREHDGTVAVVSHGAAIRTWTAGRTGNVDVQHAAANALANTGIVIANGSMADGWVVEEWDGTPIGGPQLLDVSADDPTGESLA
ncbi:histidine phosphatase family protein [Mycetocola miduiensis]|uniref:Probable phosphoglycerate mutase n=1 Tax=Mycetocola miduiensis TaxID=995034 RepID=A0A1I4YNL8_9MICO|nr:histidine phosphatase family protein [Mycetocola miduiensis]SFN39577.1 probable phosphoglycerate mutase [Mycetocola miduiensis]